MYTMTNYSTGQTFEADNARVLVRVAYQLARCARNSGEYFAINIWRTGENFAIVCRVSHGSLCFPSVGVRIS